MIEQKEHGREPIPRSLLEPWPELPPNYESVFHYTDQTSLESIARDGIRHFSEHEGGGQLSESQRHLLAFDTYCDQIAEKLGVGARRVRSVFLALHPALDTGNWSRFGKIKLEVKVDPTIAYVFNRKLHSFAAIAYYRTAEGQQWLEVDYPSGSTEREEVERMLKDDVAEDWKYYIEKYFTEAVPLSKYMSLTEEERLRIDKPEVAMPSQIDPKFIRIANDP